jgi:tetratricopeptide (TPR) repeat protein
LGLSYVASEKHDSALGYFNKAYETIGKDGAYVEYNKKGILGPYFSDQISLEAICYYRSACNYLLNNYEDAVPNLKFAIEKNYNKGNGYLFIGLMLIDSDKKSQACQALNLAVQNGNELAKKYLMENCK